MKQHLNIVYEFWCTPGWASGSVWPSAPRQDAMAGDPSLFSHLGFYGGCPWPPAGLAADPLWALESGGWKPIKCRSHFNGPSQRRR